MRFLHKKASLSIFIKAFVAYCAFLAYHFNMPRSKNNRSFRALVLAVWLGAGAAPLLAQNAAGFAPASYARRFAVQAGAFKEAAKAADLQKELQKLVQKPVILVQFNDYKRVIIADLAYIDCYNLSVCLTRRGIACFIITKRPPFDESASDARTVGQNGVLAQNDDAV